MHIQPQCRPDVGETQRGQRAAAVSPPPGNLKSLSGLSAGPAGLTHTETKTDRDGGREEDKDSHLSKFMFKNTDKHRAEIFFCFFLQEVNLVHFKISILHPLLCVYDVSRQTITYSSKI